MWTRGAWRGCDARSLARPARAVSRWTMLRVIRRAACSVMSPPVAAASASSSTTTATPASMTSAAHSEPKRARWRQLLLEVKELPRQRELRFELCRALLELIQQKHLRERALPRFQRRSKRGGRRAREPGGGAEPAHDHRAWSRAALTERRQGPPVHSRRERRRWTGHPNSGSSDSQLLL
jgi:hypothetical protein